MAEQVRIDLTADDKASKTIDHVADAAEQLEHADPEVTVTADDKASGDLEKVADAAAELERADPEVHVTADDDASRVLKDVSDEARELSRQDTELVLRARIDDARGQLKALRTDLEQTADKADDTTRHMDRIGDSRGPGLAGTAVSDLTGPLGDVSGAASDIAGVFDGLGDIVGNAAGRVGLDAEKMAGAITGIGFAVTAAAATWAYFRQRQQQAREKQRELVEGQRELNQAIADGDRVAASKKFVELYKDALDAADRFGISVQDATRFITGQSGEIPTLTAKTRELADARDDFAHSGKTIDELNKEDAALRDITGSLEGARKNYAEANGTIAEQDRRLGQVAQSLGQAERATSNFSDAQKVAEQRTKDTSDALDRLRGSLDIDQAMVNFKRSVIDALETVGDSALDQEDDVLALKQTIVDMGDDLKRTPLEIETVLNDVDQGNLQSVAQTVQQWYKDRPVQITAQIVAASKADRPGQIFPGAGPTAVRADTGGSIGTVNMVLPAGWRGDPLRQAHTARRRAGRYYSRIG